MDYGFSTIGALLGLAVSIVLIVRKVQPAYSLILGALIGGIIGGGGLTVTVDPMVSGAQSMMSSVLRILTSGILAGATASTTAGATVASQTFASSQKSLPLGRLFPQAVSRENAVPVFLIAKSAHSPGLSRGKMSL